MRVIDSQVHLRYLGIDAGIAVMDAIGIAGVVIDDYMTRDPQNRPLPGIELPNGVWRPLEDEVIKACKRHPDRLAYLLRMDPRDPEHDSRIARVKQDPHGVAVRVMVWERDEIEYLQQGGYADIFASAARHNVPMCFGARGLSHVLPSYMDQLPEMTLVIDHCGLPNKDELPASLDPVLAMARYPNTYLKWTHAPDLLSKQPYPFDDMVAYLEKALDAYGPERILWGSDHTVSRYHHSWAESLFCLRDSPRLSASDKEWILGRTAMALFNWTPAEAPSPPSHT